MTGPNPADDSDCAAALIALAEKDVDRCEWSSAEAKFHQALTSDRTFTSRIAYGVFLASRERYFDAISVFMPVLDGDDRSAIGIVCHNLASIYREVADFDLARRFQWRATLLQEDVGDEDLLGMANDAFATRRIDVAETMVLAASGMSGDDDDDFDELTDADLKATLGLTQAASGLAREGLLTLFSAYRQHQSAGNVRGMGLDLLNMAPLFGETKRHRAERSCIVRAIRCFEKAALPISCEKARHELDRVDQMQSVREFDARRN